MIDIALKIDLLTLSTSLKGWRAQLKHIQSIAPLPLPADPQPQFVPCSITKKLTCSICLGVVNRPVEFSCEHIICCDCCCMAIQSTCSLNCPCCNDHTLSSETILPPSQLLISLLNDLVVSCTKKCGRLVKLANYGDKLSSNCRSCCENVNSPSR